MVTQKIKPEIIQILTKFVNILNKKEQKNNFI